MKNLDAKGYYSSKIDSNVLEERDKYITERWEQLFALLQDGFNQMINYLLLVNFGGFMAVLAIMGFSQRARAVMSLRSSLLFFMLGAVFVGILRAIIVHRAAYFFNSWRKDVEKYHSEKMPFSEMTSNDDIRTRTAKIEFVAGYASGVCFIIAAVLGGIGIFKF